MDEGMLITFAQNALIMTATLAAPFLLVTLIIGSIISLIQAATQVNEFTLTFVPKILGIILVAALLGSWMIQQLLVYTTNLYNNLPNMIK
jgi:flagellar biosynthetic protein FliQ